MKIRAAQILIKQHEYDFAIAENAALSESNIKLQARLIALEQMIKDLQQQINSLTTIKNSRHFVFFVL